MTTTNTNVTGLLAYLATAPHDTDTWKVLADELDEVGNSDAARRMRLWADAVATVRRLWAEAGPSPWADMPAPAGARPRGALFINNFGAGWVDRVELPDGKEVTLVELLAAQGISLWPHRMAVRVNRQPITGPAQVIHDGDRVVVLPYGIHPLPHPPSSWPALPALVRALIPTLLRVMIGDELRPSGNQLAFERDVLVNLFGLGALRIPPVSVLLVDSEYGTGNVYARTAESEYVHAISDAMATAYVLHRIGGSRHGESNRVREDMRYRAHVTLYRSLYALRGWFYEPTGGVW